MALLIFLHEIAQKLQNARSGNLACKCSLVRGWRPYVYTDLLFTYC